MQLHNIDTAPILVPVVLPHSGDSSSGRVRNLPVSAQAIPRQLERRGSGWAVRGAYTDKGFVLLRDLYTAENNPDGWAKYQRYLVAMQAGTTRSSFPVADLPAVVRKWQAEPMATDEFADDFAAAVPPRARTREAKP